MRMIDDVNYYYDEACRLAGTSDVRTAIHMLLE
jgi:hypothetical protein